ncbi:hypothetical protein [Dorea sp.]|uniref:hypothetical protein n=1 Tax=Dorea sp. TaxID=2040332 RepID=UPI0035290625
MNRFFCTKNMVFEGQDLYLLLPVSPFQPVLLPVSPFQPVLLPVSPFQPVLLPVSPFQPVLLPVSPFQPVLLPVSPFQPVLLPVSPFQPVLLPVRILSKGLSSRHDTFCSRHIYCPVWRTKILIPYVCHILFEIIRKKEETKCAEKQTERFRAL